MRMREMEVQGHRKFKLMGSESEKYRAHELPRKKRLRDVWQAKKWQNIFLTSFVVKYCVEVKNLESH